MSTNYALAANGGVITASVESLGAGTRFRANNGSRNAGGGFSAIGGFQQNGAPNWIVITYPAPTNIDEVNLIWAQDADINSSTDPTLTSPGTTYAANDYDIEAFYSGSWHAVLTITANNKQWRQHTGLALTSIDAIRVNFTSVRAGANYFLEIETWGNPPPPVISTSSLPDGSLAVPYSQTVVATGGAGGNVWTVNSGALPTGLTINSGTGEISGTPSASGTFSFTIRVTDSAAGFDDQALSIFIATPPQPVNGVPYEIIQLLARGTGYYVTAVRVTARPELGGEEMAYVLHSRKIVYDGSTFLPMAFEASKFQQNAGVETDHSTVTSMLGELFDRINIRGGKWSGADIELLGLDILNLAAGPVRRQVGRVGDIHIGGEQAETQVRGSMQLLTQEIGDRTSKLCRYRLGDENCGIPLEPFTFAGEVVSVFSRQRITVTVDKPDEYFKSGRIKFVTGANAGLEMDTMTNDNQIITLWMPMGQDIAVDDQVLLIAGDDKTLYTCHNKFHNAINHGAEDCLPRREDVYRFPD